MRTKSTFDSDLIISDTRGTTYEELKESSSTNKNLDQFNGRSQSIMTTESTGSLTHDHSISEFIHDAIALL
jgi:hypothetical protein